MVMTESLLEMLSSTWEREPWKSQAKCRGLPRGWFFSGSDRSEEDLRGLQVCGTCPVREECLDYALRNRSDYGIFGGLTALQRKRIRWKRDRAARPRSSP